ncbi:MAG TPA: lysophospholipid acyltransferase family protein [Tepidisphaeraceae bacterium]|jgi:1-acyl-sn-glycerol-3-phosphate acyltransferase
MHERSFVWKSLQIIARVGTTLFFGLKTYGRENVPKTGGVLLVANHQSYLDPVLVAVHLYRPVSFLAKSELFENPFLAGLIRLLKAFPVRQGEGDVGAVKEVIRRLNEGYALNIYPEGTRTLTGDIEPLEKGIALIIRRANVPVIPVAIHGSFDAWPKGSAIFHPHPIHLQYGKPMDFTGKKGDQIVQELHAEMKRLLAELREKY